MSSFLAKFFTLLPHHRKPAVADTVHCALMAGTDHARPGARSMNVGWGCVEVMTRKAKHAVFITAMALLLTAYLPPETLAQDGTDRVTGFPRDPVRVDCMARRQEGRGQLRTVRRGVRIRSGPSLPP